ncbi:MAG: exodeoxyribonuclease VII small subunit [Thermodesulfobacteriota bacterium]
MAKKSFEESMEKLEKIVEELEAGSLSLDKALKKFEEGVSLSRFCFEKLDETEKKITALMQQQDGSVTETPFDSNQQQQNGPGENE